MIRALAAALAFCFIAPPAPAQPAQAPERLFVFLHDGDPAAKAVSDAFRQDRLPVLEDAARRAGIPISIIDAAQRGAPADVTAIPHVVYAGTHGLLHRRGPLAAADHARSWLNAVRRTRSGLAARHEHAKILISERGRARVLLHVTVAPLAGEGPTVLPDKHASNDQLALTVRDALTTVDPPYRAADTALLAHSDRVFFLDVYPSTGIDRQLILTADLFDAADPLRPVHLIQDPPISGPWNDRISLASALARPILAAIDDHLADPRTGWQPLAAEHRNTPWEVFLREHALPAVNSPPATPDDGPPTLLRTWSLRPGAQHTTDAITFRFAPPVVGYSGAVRKLQAALSVTGDARSLSGAFAAQTASLTFGSADLDDSVHSSMFLDVEKFPKATFRITSVDGPAAPLALGLPVPLTLRGDFSLLGKVEPIIARAVVEPTIDADDREVLRFAASFRLNLGPWPLDTPEGPEHSRKTMFLTVSTELLPGD